MPAFLFCGYQIIAVRPHKRDIKVDDLLNKDGCIDRIWALLDHLGLKD